jgi:hypothetical protein
LKLRNLTLIFSDFFVFIKANKETLKLNYFFALASEIIFQSF